MLRLVAFVIAIGLTAPAPAADVLPATPVDQVARQTFHREDPQLVDAIAELNRDVNGAITYETDQEHYGVSDHWVGRPPDMKGDCEDYALTKLEILGDAGFPIISNARIRTVTVTVGKETYGHAVLEVRMPHGSVMELDSRFDEPMRRKDLERKQGYRFFDW